MVNKNTLGLENELTATKDIELFFDKNADVFKDYTLPQYLEKLMNERSLTKAEVANTSGMDKSYVYHIFDGKKKNPGRKKILALALAMKLTAKETQYLLYYAGVARLYVKNSWDSVIWHALEKHLSVMETNQLLDQLAETDMVG